MVKCTVCGADVPSTAPFCNNCGQPRLPQPSAQQPPSVGGSTNKTQTAAQQAAAPRNQPEPTFTPTSVPEQTALPPVQESVVPAPPTTIEPRVTRRSPALWVVGTVLGCVLLGVWLQHRSHAPHTEAPTVRTVPPSQVPPVPPGPPATPPPVKPVILQFTNLGNFSNDGSTWYARIKWMTLDAKHLVLDTGKERFDLDPGMGSRDIDLTSDHAIFHLTAYNGDEAVTQDVTADRPQSSAQPSTPTTATDADPVQIVNFKVGDRVDTTVGSALRIWYQVTGSSDVHLLHGDQDLKLNPLNSYIDFFTSRRVVLTLKVISTGGDVTKELTIAPDPTVDAEVGSQETGPPLHDSLDIVSSMAQVRDFSALSVNLTDPLVGYLRKALDGADKATLSAYRNAIFAKHGYVFKNKDWQDIFTQEAWYHPDTSNVEEVDRRFSARERNNVTWFLSKEKTAPQ